MRKKTIHIRLSSFYLFRRMCFQNREFLKQAKYSLQMLDSNLAGIGKTIYFHVQFYKRLSLLQPTLSKQETDNVTEKDQNTIILQEFNGCFD